MKISRGRGNGSKEGLRARDESVHDGQLGFEQIRGSYSLCFPPVHIAREGLAHPISTDRIFPKLVGSPTGD